MGSPAPQQPQQPHNSGGKKPLRPAVYDPNKGTFYAMKKAQADSGREPTIQVQNLDAEYRKKAQASRSQSQDPAENVPFTVTARGNIKPKPGMAKQAQSIGVDRIFDIPYNPYRTRVAVETPVSDREQRARFRYYMAYEPIVAAAIDMHCFPPGEMIQTRQGFIQVDQATLDDEVLGLEGQFQKVKACTQQPYDGDLVTIKAVGQLSYRTTPNHPFLVRTPVRGNRKHPNRKREKDKCTMPSEVSVWKRADEVEVGDYLIFPKYRVSARQASVDLAKYALRPMRKYGSVQYWVHEDDIETAHKSITFKRKIQIDDHLGELIGWYVAEGSGKLSSCFSVGPSRQDAERVAYLVQEVFGLWPTIVDKQPNNLRVVLANKLIASFFQDVCGHGAHNKRIPQFVLEADREVAKAFLRGYLRGDGCDRERYDYTCVTVSEQLARQLQLLASKCSVYFSIKKITNTHNAGQFVLGASKSSVLPRIFDVPWEAQRDRLPYVQEDEKNFYVPVRSLGQESYKGTVYNLTTPDNTFTAPVVVHNTEYPISSFHLQHSDPTLEQECNDMIDELDLFEFVLQMVHEYWGVGGAYPFGVFDDAKNPSEWIKFIMLDPDKVVLNTHMLLRGPRAYQIQLLLDETIRAIVEKGPHDPNTGKLFWMVPPDVRKFARLNQPIPLPEPQVTHFRRVGSNPFNYEGESIIQRIMHVLAYKDKLRDAQYHCLTADAEVLTDKGFIKIPEVTKDHEVACYNPENDELAFMNPIDTPSFDYEGDLYRFQSTKVDIEVTDNHRMLVTDENHRWKDQPKWYVKKARDVRYYHYFKTNGNLVTYDEPPGMVELGGAEIPLDDFLEFAGYYISEGSAWAKKGVYKERAVCITQSKSEARQTMAECLDRLPYGFATHWNSPNMVTRNDALWRAVRRLFGKDSHTRKVPAWIKRLPPDKLEIFLRAAVLGDGSVGKGGSRHDYVTYSTASVQLADDIQEIAWRAGFCPVRGKPWKAKSGTTMRHIFWSWDRSRGRIHGLQTAKVTTRPYKGKVYCLTVPTEFFVVRQNGKIVIVGNTAERHATPREIWKLGTDDVPADDEVLQQFQDLLSATWLDPNQAIVYGHQLSVDVIGTADKILPLRDEYTNLEMEMLAGLMLNKAMIYGEGPCVDDQTEVLTDDGWKFCRTVADGDRLASYDPNTGRMKYQNFLQRIIMPWNGPMLDITGPDYDLSVTPNHRMFYRRADSKVNVFDQAETMQVGDELPGRVSAWVDDHDFASDPEAAVQILGVDVDLTWFAKFAGLYLSEGCTIINTSTRVYQIRLRQSKKIDAQYQKFRGIVEKSPWAFRTYERKDGTTEWVWCNKKLAYWFKDQFGERGTNKHIPAWLRHINALRLRGLLDALVLGDGHVRVGPKHQQDPVLRGLPNVRTGKSYRGFPRVVYTSVSEQLADDVQEIALKCGFTPTRIAPSGPNNPTFRVVWQLDQMRREWIASRISERHYKGDVYCFEVPFHYMVYRRNGKMAISGQTYANASVGLEVLISRYVTLRHKIEKWVRKAVIAPIFRLHKIYKQPKANLEHRIRTRDKRMLDLPYVRWDKAIYRENDSQVKLLQAMVDKNLVPRKMLFESLGIDPKSAEKELIDQDRRDAARARQKKEIEKAQGAPAGVEPAGGGGGGGTTGLPPLPPPPPPPPELGAPEEGDMPGPEEVEGVEEL